MIGIYNIIITASLLTIIEVHAIEQVKMWKYDQIISYNWSSQKQIKFNVQYKIFAKDSKLMSEQSVDSKNIMFELHKKCIILLCSNSDA